MVVPKRDGALVASVFPTEVVSVFVPNIEAVLETAPKIEGVLAVMPNNGVLLVLGMPNIGVVVVPNCKDAAEVAPKSGWVVELAANPVDSVELTVEAGLGSA